MRASWCEVTRREPCAVCGKGDWCSRSVDGAWVVCRRVDAGTDIHRIDQAGGEFWLYHMDGSLSQPRQVVDMPSYPTAPCVDAGTRDRVYRALLAALPLTAAHRQALRQRGLTDTEILRRGYRTLPHQGRARVAKRLVESCGPACAQVPGLYVSEWDGRRWWTLAGAAGLLIPVRDLEGHIVALKVRIDAPGDGPKYTYVSSAKHGGPGPGANIHVPLSTGVRGETVRITEGELKADVATALSGMLTLSIPGVSCWRAVLPIFERLHPHQVRLAFDKDWRVKPQVAEALTGVAFALMRANYRVTMDDWYDQPEKGIDDLLMAGKMPVVKSAALALSARDRVHAQHGKGRGVWRA